ncbi:hypothetical protein ScPMuIL_016294 [Solemya velum]
MSDEKRGNPPGAIPPPAYSDATGFPPQQTGYQGYPPPGNQPMYPQGPGATQPMMYQYNTQYGQPGYATGGTNVVVAPGPVTMAEAPPPDYMGRAIFATLCCFWPIGIFALWKASTARSDYARGDFAAARANSQSARTMSNIAIIAGVVSIIISLIIVGIYVGVIMNTAYQISSD